jgi:hypothetical protein
MEAAAADAALGAFLRVAAARAVGASVVVVASLGVDMGLPPSAAQAGCVSAAVAQRTHAVDTAALKGRFDIGSVPPGLNSFYARGRERIGDTCRLFRLCSA